ncbi:hypothetical protein HSB1_38320 [Halogranum salarium B-1]|uniref:Uncharacterized protein n=1 Tax=Halogranum salarium B-1 TaxID=1210908 RepID=J2ZCL4_9EURY|nr:hypothetical protein HSB1_38320 [Halogranum salarium B-1]
MSLPEFDAFKSGDDICSSLCPDPPPVRSPKVTSRDRWWR